MALTSIFTGDPAKEAAEQQRAYLDQTRNSALGYTQQGQDASLANITGGYDAARSNLTGGYNTATGAVNTGANNAIDYLGEGYGTARGYLDQAGTAYDALSGLGSKYGGATTMALNALGVNGQAGTDAARAAFKASDAYNFNLEQNLEAINRRRNMGGMLDSGNADRDAQTFGAGLASNEHQTWMNNLLGFKEGELGATSGAATGRANIFGQQANTASQYGINRAGVASGRGAMLADLSNRYGTNMGLLDTGEAGSLAAINTGAANSRIASGQANAGAYGQTYKNAADAEMAGSGNLWKLGMSAAQLATGGLGGGLFGTGTTGASNLGSMFSSGGSNPFNPDGSRNTLAYR